jgi:acyl-CoA thioesterase FadM
MPAEYRHKRRVQFYETDMAGIVEVRLQIAEIAEKTIRYTCIISRGETKIATGSLTVACVSKRPNEPMRSIPISADIAARFAS